MNRIVLLDLNYTLVANSSELGYPHHERLHMEEYRITLLRMIREEHVILITVRPDAYREPTLERIRDYLGWSPQEAYFNKWQLNAPTCKARILQESIFPKHGNDPKRYWAIESNEETRKMYAKLGIHAQHYRELIGIPPPASKGPTLF